MNTNRKVYIVVILLYMMVKQTKHSIKVTTDELNTLLYAINSAEIRMHERNVGKDFQSEVRKLWLKLYSIQSKGEYKLQ